MLVSSNRLKPISVVPVERSRYIMLMEATYRRQVRNFEQSRMRRKAAEKFEIPESDVTELHIAAMTSHYEAQLLAFFAKSLGKPVIGGFGSSRDEVLAKVPGIETTIRAIADAAVQSGIGCAHGDWGCGVMGLYKRLWTEARNAYPDAGAFTIGIPLMGQEVGGTVEESVPSWYLDEQYRDDLTSPPQVAMIGRCLAILAAGLNLANLYGPPGKGTLEELKRTRLERQMRGKNATIFSWRSDGTLPPDLLIDERRPDGGWIWDSTLEEARMQTGIGTVRPDEFEGEFVLRVGLEEEVLPSPIKVLYFDTPEDLGAFVVEQACEVHRALAASIA